MPGLPTLRLLRKWFLVLKHNSQWPRPFFQGQSQFNGEVHEMKPNLKLVAANENAVKATSKWASFSRKFAAATVMFAFSAVKNTVKTLRYVIFYVLMWLRMLVHFVTSVCAGLGLLVLVLGLILKPEWGYLWKIGAFSFGAFLAGWLYDGLLLLIAPEQIMLDGRMNN